VPLPEIEEYQLRQAQLAARIAALNAEQVLALIYYVSAESAGEVIKQSWPDRSTVEHFINHYLDSHLSPSTQEEPKRHA
jgi:hypothetical protein